MSRRGIATTLACFAVAGCGDPEARDAAAPARTPEPTALAIRSAQVKRSDGGRLITALRGTSTPGATITVYGRSTTTGPAGTWAIRTSYDRSREAITVGAVAEGRSPTSSSVTQPKRPKLRVSSSTGRTTTTDLTTLKGRVAVSRGALGAVRVTVNGQPAVVVGSRWSMPVTVARGTRSFKIRASRSGADGGTLTLTKTRKLSVAENAARAAQREAERQARIAEREARKAARRAARQAKLAAENAASECDPNYEGACLDPNVGDYDCAGGSGDGPEYVDGPVTVVGSDPFDLDRDSDGVGCE